MINSAINTFEKLKYSEKLEAYNRVFSLGYISHELNDKFILISLIALTTSKLREKNASITPLEILVKITGESNTESSFYQFLEALSIIVEDMSYGCTKFNSYGYKTSAEIINKIKEILNTWLPF